MADANVVGTALALIASNPFSPAQHKLLSCFINDSVDPEATAHYFLHRTAQNAGSERDVEHKRWWDLSESSRTVPANIVPKELVEELGTASHISLRELLIAFLSHNQFHYLNSLINPGPNNVDRLRNAWTLTQSAATAFRSGNIQLEPEWDVSEGSEDKFAASCRYQLIMVPPAPFPLLTTQGGVRLRSLQSIVTTTSDPDVLPLPSTFLFRVHARFCNSLRWLQIQEQMQHGWPARLTFPSAVQSLFCRLPNGCIRYLRRSWLSVPQSLRILSYRLLLNIGSRLYENSLAWIRRVPFGLYIKHGRGNLVPKGEASALTLVEQHTDISAPRLIDSITSDNHTYLVTTQVPGVSLGQVIHLMSYPERTQLAADIRTCISQFRQIPNTNDATICDAVGGPVFDYRIPRDLAGPFNSETDFNDCLTERLELKAAVADTHERSHKIYFAHADLNLSNILVRTGTLSGLVDFGCAGFYPEYWEFTKAMYSEMGGPDTAWKDLVLQTFGSLYTDELTAEQKLWENCTPW
ncbi:MAG: hypothetical protein M1837_000824 [Sclerophora amabilis]|nr:MAG: hypothetical protein M1837_000824 [Sclerophora amabilis]